MMSDTLILYAVGKPEPGQFEDPGMYCDMFPFQMSSEENKTVKEKISLSSSTQENHEAGSQQTQSSVFLTNGHKEVTAMENQLPDLNSFKGNHFVQILGGAGTDQSQQLGQPQSAQFVVQTSNINGVKSTLLTDYVNSPGSKNIGETLHVNTDQSPVQASSNFKVSSNMPTFESLNTQQQSNDYSIDRTGVLHRLLSREHVAEKNLHVSIQPSTFTVSSPTEYTKSSPTSSANSPYGDSNLSPFAETSPNMSFIDTDPQTTGFKDLSKTVNVSDTTTQSSLITNTGNLKLDSMVENNVEMKYEMACEWNVTKLEEDLERDHTKNGKVPRLIQDSDASSALSPSVDTVFRAEGAQQEIPSDFTFQLFGQGETDQNAMGMFSSMVSENEVSSSQDITPVQGAVRDQHFKTPQTLSHSVVKQQRERLRRSKEPILSQAFPSKFHGYELRILEQPEEQHRARYLTEGSRGSVKNRSGSGYPQVKLFGYTGEATLQVFIGNDSGRVRPHGFYQACKVCGKNSTMCIEKDIDGTTVIEIELQSANDMTASIDCVGILKLRNADVEQRIGITKAKKKSTKARMIFRVTFQKPCGSPQVLQVASSTILCTQPIGQPEICKMSLKECSVAGGEELYIIGKNFLRGTQVLFQQIDEDDETGQVIWQKEGDIDKDYFQTTHMIVTVPEYSGQAFTGTKVECQVIVNSGGKLSDSQPFFYKAATSAIASQYAGNMLTMDPTTVIIKQDTMETMEESRKRNYPFVAPEALELNQQIQQIQQVSSNSDMFQLPPGIISGMADNDRFSPMEQSSQEASPANEPAVDKEHIEDVGTDSTQTLEQKSYVQENMETPQTWDTDQNTVLNTDSEKNELNVDLNSLNFPAMNSEEYSEQPMDNSYVHAKSPRLSNEGFPTEHIGITNPRHSETSIVSQFLQNMSMGLKQSDPMLSGKETVLSKLMAPPNNTILTTMNSQMLMTTNTHHSQCGINTSEKSQTLEHSFLKEALTCPTASLANIHSLTSQCQPTALFVPKSENIHTPMDMQMDHSLISCSQALGQKSEDVMEYNPSASVNMNSQAPCSVFGNTQSYKMADTTQFSSKSSSVDYTSDPAVQSQFSPSHILTSLNITEAMNTEMKPIMNQASQISSSIVHNTSQHLPAGSHSFTQESQSHHKTIMSTMEQSHGSTQFDLPASAHHGSSQHVSLVQQLKSPAQGPSDSISTILQQMLSQTGITKQQQQTLAAPEQQQQQQQQYQQQTEHVNEQQQFYQQQHFQQQGQDETLAQTQQHYHQNQEQQQQQQQQEALQQQLFQLVNQPQSQQQQLQSQPVLMMSPSSSIQPTVTVKQAAAGHTPVAASVPNQSQNPLAPQIIICNNPSPQSQIPQAQYGSPSIVIVPGQAGPNNQVENLLRSILGSIMQPPPQQQQQQMQSQHQQQQQPPR